MQNGDSRVRIHPHQWIELSDGCRLSARVWLPETAEPAPAVLEYLPYRKDDLTAWQDSTRHPYFAANGYASVRVDQRGTGDSDGIICDEYLKQEQDDALEVIDWISRQPWCTGAVGMIGYSWGGFNGLQVAARRPPNLKAVISLYSTDDRYTDDCHYVGGALLAGDMLRWAQTMRAINALPPSPEVAGEDWREIWRARLEETPHFVEAWLSHQTRDGYWRQGSIAEDYSAIDASTLLVGGWADAYTNAVPRMLESLSCPRAAIIGPWAHIFPERGIPGPAIGFLQECVAWFDRWLKGEPDAWAGRPELRVWLQEPARPSTFYAERPGRWLSFPRWPGSRQEHLRLWLDAGERLMRQAAATGLKESEQPLEIRGVQSCGENGGVWCPNGRAEELPADQGVDDARSMHFDTEPLGQRLEMLGNPVATLQIEADAPRANVIVRLCDVAPDGASTLLTYGVLNLAQRDSSSDPSPVEPGRRYEVRVALNAIGQAVERGHQLRLSVSPTYWPLVWPAPTPVTLRITPAGSWLDLPLLPAESQGGWSFEGPEYASPLETREMKSERSRNNQREGDRSVTAEREMAESVFAGDDLRIRTEGTGRWIVRDEEPLSARFECARDYLLERGDWRVKVLCASEMTADSDTFLVTEQLTVFDGDEVFFAHEDTFEIARGLL
ncbi:MAG TPA: CocE/NonD family hydrolase [Coriobacteriia bacterium]|nr:CocE/NonD family hydrolase [Coriobacteriia bacterium]